MRYKAVIFDFDYTLGDCTEGIAASINTGLKQMGYEEVGMELVRKSVGMTLEDTYTFLTEDKDEEKRKQFATLFIQKANEVMTSCSKFLPFARETLELLYEKKIPVGIVSTKHKFRLEGILELHKAEHLVQYLNGTDCVKHAKPDPEGLLMTIAEMGLDKSEVLYVGDHVIDAMTAQNAGVDFAAVTTGTTTREEFEQYPCAMIMEDIRPILTCI